MSEKEFSPETMEKLKKLMARVDELVKPMDTVLLHPKRGKTTVFDSKMGGVPYFPKSMEYPVVREGEYKGKPLYFLAQLNFGTLPKIPGFPTEGILQFFAGCKYASCNGMNMRNELDQNKFRVIYHENIITDESKLYSQNDMPRYDDNDEDYDDDEWNPVNGEYLLTADKTEPMSISWSDYRFEKAYVEAYNEIFGGNVSCVIKDEIFKEVNESETGIYDIDPDLADAIGSLEFNGTRIGGYPFITLGDVRGYNYNEKYTKCTVLLFQADLEEGGEEYKPDNCYPRGEQNVANFFIDPEDLAKRNFSQVMFNWNGD